MNKCNDAACPLCSRLPGHGGVKNEGGVTTITGDGIVVAQFLTTFGALRMKARFNMEPTRGYQVVKTVRSIFGWKERTAKALLPKYLAFMQQHGLLLGKVINEKSEVVQAQLQIVREETTTPVDD